MISRTPDISLNITSMIFTGCQFLISELVSGFSEYPPNTGLNHNLKNLCVRETWEHAPIEQIEGRRAHIGL
jgi:hypothetical protein